MKTSKILFLGAALATNAVFGELLYWTVGSSPVTVEGASTEYAYASIYSTSTQSSTDSSTDTFYNNYANGAAVGDFLSESVIAAASAVAADIGSNATSLYFYIELYDSSYNTVARSAVTSYSDLASYIASDATAAMMSGTSAWQGGTWTAVPEPTSGLMLLLGASVLALRRRKLA